MSQLKFWYHGLVYIFGEVDRPEVVFFETMTESFGCSLSDLDAHDCLHDGFETDNLPVGMHEVFIEGHVEFSNYETQDGPEYDQDVVIDKQTWSVADPALAARLCPPDVEPVFVFWSASPVPQPDWILHGTAKPMWGPEDAEPTHHIWRRVDDDKKTLYQMSAIGDKMPTLKDGAYYDISAALLCKDLMMNILMEN